GRDDAEPDHREIKLDGPISGRDADERGRHLLEERRRHEEGDEAGGHRVTILRRARPLHQRTQVVIPDGPKGRAGTQPATPACAESWVPALALRARPG